MRWMTTSHGEVNVDHFSGLTSGAGAVGVQLTWEEFRHAFLQKYERPRMQATLLFNV
jgi:hypothetical protein